MKCSRITVTVPTALLEAATAISEGLGSSRLVQEALYEYVDRHEEGLSRDDLLKILRRGR